MRLSLLAASAVALTLLAIGCGPSYAPDSAVADMAHSAGTPQVRDMSVSGASVDLAVAPPDLARIVWDFSMPPPDLVPPGDMVNPAQVMKCAMTACPDPVFDCWLFGCSGATCQNGYCVFR